MSDAAPLEPHTVSSLRSLGASLNPRKAMGIDVCEAGFPIASPGDFAAVKMIAETIGTPHANHGALRTALG